MLQIHDRNDSEEGKPPVDFLWLELTNQCNLRCTHCYAESGPFALVPNRLTTHEYKDILNEMRGLGCKHVQFIGGEPTLNRDLPELIREAAGLGFEFIEVFTNLTYLSSDLLQCFIDHKVHVATSVYSNVGSMHDLITQVDGSFEKTTGNLRRLVKAGIDTRAAVIEMSENDGQAVATFKFLLDLGVDRVGADRLRRIGRGAVPDGCSGMKELCGNCAGGTICVAPDGVVSPCIMSKKRPVGSVKDQPLSAIATGERMRFTRQQIGEATAANWQSPSGNCGPDSLCQPCQPHGSGCTPCSPISSCPPTWCQPYKGW